MTYFTTVLLACVVSLAPLLDIYSHCHLPLLSMQRRTSVVIKLHVHVEELKKNVSTTSSVHLYHSEYADYHVKVNISVAAAHVNPLFGILS